MDRAKRKLIYVDEPPEGLFYIRQFLTPAEEEQLLTFVKDEPFVPYDHFGYKAKREIVFYGSGGEYDTDAEQDAVQSVPDWLEPLRHRCAVLIGLAGEELEMALVAHYPQGAGIGWHRDRPQYGPTVLGVSLLSNAEMRFRRMSRHTEEMFKMNMEHGSAYIMSGPARSVWQHGMRPVEQVRYSITFRTVINSPKHQPGDARHDPANIAARLRHLGLPASQEHSREQAKQLNLFEMRP